MMNTSLAKFRGFLRDFSIFILLMNEEFDIT